MTWRITHADLAALPIATSTEIVTEVRFVSQERKSLMILPSNLNTPPDEKPDHNQLHDEGEKIRLFLTKCMTLSIPLLIFISLISGNNAILNQTVHIIETAMPYIFAYYFVQSVKK